MSAADEFLLAFHRAHPGSTSRAYAGGRVGAGGSSYDLLTDCVPRDLESTARVLDLGCGDGHLLELLTRRGLSAGQLTGVDLSPEELVLARARPALEGCLLVQGRGQRLRLPEGTVAVVLSHLAFMLMDDAEQVAREVRRVLRRSGVFATLVGGGPKVGDAFELLLDLLAPLLRQMTDPMPSLGDPRCRSEQGLDEVLGAVAGFAGPPRIEDFTVDLSGTFPEVWATLSSMYELHRLPAALTAELQTAFEPQALALGTDGVTVPCSMFVRRVVARRAP